MLVFKALFERTNQIKGSNSAHRRLSEALDKAMILFSSRFLNIFFLMMAQAESENPVSVSAMLTGKFFANPESFCDKFIIG